MMKKIVLSTVLALSINLNAGGIPVVDALANSQIQAQNIKEIAEWAKEAQRWVDTTTHFQAQLTAYQNELLAKTGIRDAVQFVQDINSFYKFAQAYKGDYLDLGVDILDTDSYLGLKAQALFDRYNVFNDCEGDYLSDREKAICKNKMVRRVHEVAVYQEYSNNLDDMSNDLNELAVKLANTQDIKESQDIGNAIQLKIAQIDLTKTQVELMNAQNARLDMIEQKQKEQVIQSLKGKASGLDDLINELNSKH